MLSQMSHEQFDEWCAKDLIEPIGTNDSTCRILTKIGRIIAAFMGQEMKDKDFMPWIAKHKKRAKPKALSPKQSGIAIAAHLRVLAGMN
jgi:uncharacterized protein YktB (UPF0637 family)